MPVDLKKLFARLNPLCLRALEGGAAAAVSRGHYEVTVEHVLARLVEERDADVSLLLAAAEADTAALRRGLDRTLEGIPSGNTGKPVFSPLLIDLVQDAWLLASIDLGEMKLRSGALLLALAARSHRYGSGSYLDLLKPLSRDRFVADFAALTTRSAESESTSGASPSTSAGSDALSRFCTDFTAKAAAGDIDPVFGRDREIAQMIDILARRRKNNPIVVGEAGVGKTAVAEGLALRIVQGDVPDLLQGVRLVGLDMGLLQAGAGVKGEFENRLKNVIEEVKGSPRPVILFIDEAHTLIGAGGPQGGGDAANLLKPALARGELRTIAATTWSEYKKYFEKDAALARRFQPVKLDEPDVEAAALILRGLKERYEEAHGVTIRDDAVVAAAELSHRYIAGRQLPDKAVDLLDTAAARVKIMLTGKPAPIEEKERRIAALEREKEGLRRDADHAAAGDMLRIGELETELGSLQVELAGSVARWEKERELAHRIVALHKAAALPPEQAEETQQRQDELLAAKVELATLQADEPLVRVEVDPDVVAKVVADWTGIPVGKVMRERARSILDLEDNLSVRIRGQHGALSVIAEGLKASAAGITDPQHPKGIFLLVGPSGVGKTETALAVADLLFGGERFLTTINMSEFQEAHTVSRLIGSPPGYVGFGEGGVLTEAVRQRPYSVVLIDEVEKGHPDVMNLFYQVFDKGHLADGEGRIIDFSNTVLFLTSNLGSDIVTKCCSGGTAPEMEELQEALRPVLASRLKPALLARMTVVPYRTLAQEHMAEIVAIKLAAVSSRMSHSAGMSLNWTERVTASIVSRCTDIDSGARAADHIMKRTLLPLLSREILVMMGEESSAAAATVDVGDDGFTVAFGA